jgi:hypothetical protein
MSHKEIQDRLTQRPTIAFSAISWSGFNVYGDELSIKHVRECIHARSSIKEWREECVRYKDYAEYWHRCVDHMCIMLGIPLGSPDEVLHWIQHNPIAATNTKPSTGEAEG